MGKASAAQCSLQGRPRSAPVRLSISVSCKLAPSLSPIDARNRVASVCRTDPKFSSSAPVRSENPSTRPPNLKQKSRPGWHSLSLVNQLTTHSPKNIPPPKKLTSISYHFLVPTPLPSAWENIIAPVQNPLSVFKFLAKFVAITNNVIIVIVVIQQDNCIRNSACSVHPA